MVSFVTGPSGSGKSTIIKDMISRLASSGEKAILIVPEQFSFESERDIYKSLGAAKAANVKVVSFSRLAGLIFGKYGGFAGKTADSTQKLVFMEMAVSQVKDALKYYKKAAGYKSFVPDMLKAVEELKTAGVGPKELYSTASHSGDKTLAEKTADICLLYEAYQAVMERVSTDPSDALEKALNKAQGKGFFKEYTVFFDEFKSFTGAQIKLIGLIMEESRECVFSLCLDEGEVFAPVRDTYNTLKRMARKRGVSVSAPIKAERPVRFKNKELEFLERNIFADCPETFGESCKNVAFAYAGSIYDEVDYAAASISGLIREKGYRYRDFAVIVPDEEIYETAVKSSFDRYGIVYYADKAIKITDFPIIRFVTELLRLSFISFDIDCVFVLLKCGLSPFTQEEISEFENYCFVWGISGTRLKNQLTDNPNGYSEKFGEEEKQKLELYNSIREYILRLVGEISLEKGATAKEIGAKLFETLDREGVAEKAEAAAQQADAETSLLYARAWEALVDIVESVAAASGEYIYSKSRYFELFLSVCGEYDMGVFPRSLDAVTVGTADRMRIGKVRAVFIIGAQKDVFPQIPKSNGIFRETEYKLFSDAGMPIAKPFEDRLAEQRFNAYKALTMPSEMLFVSGSLKDQKGSPALLSDIFLTAEKMFGSKALVDISSLNGEYFCKNEKTAFWTLSKRYLKDDEETASIMEFLREYPEYAGKLETFELARDKSSATLKQPESIEAVFPKRLYVSPSGIEEFYKCKFRYFCSKGLRVHAKRRAELNPLETGTIIHYALEKLVSYEDFLKYDSESLRNKVSAILDDYLEKVMSGSESKSERFTYLFGRLKDTVFNVAEHLKEQMAQSSFYPADLELKIEDGSDVKPLRFSFGGLGDVCVGGRVDRVDMAEINGSKYVAVIDYKSGEKKFILSDVYYGLNLQMLIYLFCIWKNGKGKYKNAIPAGILYMPSRVLRNTVEDREKGDFEASRRAQYKMNGLILKDDNVFEAMEKGVNGIYVPVKVKKDGSIDSRMSSVADIEQMGKLYRHTEELIKEMAKELKEGDIRAVPISDGNQTACDWCDYAGVCGVEEPEKVRLALPLKPDKVYDMIEGGTKQDGSQTVD